MTHRKTMGFAADAAESAALTVATLAPPSESLRPATGEMTG